MTAIFDRGIPSQSLAGPWKLPLFQLGLVCGWLLLVHWETIQSMAAIWVRSETFAHGFLVPPIALWLIWRQRRSLLQEQPAASWAANGIFLLAGAAWLVGYLASANALAQVALVASLAGLVPALLGWKAARRLAFPLGFLLFAVPMGEFLLPRLMDWTATFTVLGLRFSGVPVYRDGLDFVIPSGNWSVVEACSGIRYLIASLMAGTLFAYLNYRSLGRRLAFVGISMVVPLVANWLRAYLIVMLGHLSGNELATGADHLVYGWVFFGIVIGLMFFIGARWSEGEPAPAGAAITTRTPARVPAQVPVPGPAAAGGWGRAALAAFLVALPALLAGSLAGDEPLIPPRLNKDPGILAPSGWRPVAMDTGSVPTWAAKDATDTWQQLFEKDGHLVGLHIAYYQGRGASRKLVAPFGSLPAEAARNWRLAKEEEREVRLGGNVLTVNEGALRSRTSLGLGDATVLWQWYWAGGHMTTSPQAARLYSAWSRLLGRGDAGAVIVLYAPAGQPEGAEAALEAFSRSAGFAISQILNETRSRP